jgi:hypothetical protein
MRRMLLVLALAAGAALAWPETANAQHFHPRHRGGWSAGYGYGVPGYGYGYYGSPWRYRGHYDYHPGHFHRYGYVPPHIDYHHRGHSHAVDPWTGLVSPYRHRHRHWH